ncbi:MULTISPECIES: TonB-dependent receptor [unclassified Azospirillum]|uniref:TonB-dependent receptor n=1 Tax=unclassified Azospirillum TaxID=2630922 RepID=UPI000B6C1E04|nr:MULTISPECIES: TonB-dependent receptor [unclassified Azospirillum]SNS13466.1 TonB-dependent receptor [Azospirillum sp. RU38E]SNS30596.1 TonB-dependent receptor [Azospirillum sp. RU37A]
MSKLNRAFYLMFAAGVSALSLSAQAQVANGADAGGEVLEEIIVTGFRGSVAKARDLKRDAVGSRESIVGDDVAAFPDLNLAESLQRVPGITITRDAGEGRQVSMRGLGPDFTRVKLNGMEVLGTTQSIDSRGGTNRSRSFDFNLFASELFNRMDIVKSTAAEEEEGGIAGAIDLRTAKPFDYNKFTFSAAAKGSYGANSDKVDPRGAVLIADTFADGRFGALVSAAYSKRNTVEQGYSTVRWAAGGWTPGNISNSIDPATKTRLLKTSSAADALYYPRFARYNEYVHDQDRLGVTAAFQAKPADWVQMDLDLLYGKLKSDRREYNFDAFAFSTNNTNGSGKGLPEIKVDDVTIDRNNIIAGKFRDVDVRSDSQLYQDETDFRAATLNTKLTPTEDLTINLYGGYQEAKFTDDQQGMYVFSPNTSFSYDFRQNDKVAAQTYGINVTDPAAWQFFQARLRDQAVDNRFRTVRLDANYALTDEFYLKAGLDWRRFTYDSTSHAFDSITNLNGRALRGVSLTDPALAGTYTTTPYKFGKGLDAPAGTPTGWIVADLDNAFAKLGTGAVVKPVSSGFPQGVAETTKAAYVQADWDRSLFGLPMKGNIGLRAIRTETSAYDRDPSFPAVSISRSYTDWLPSFNVVLETSEETRVRFGANRNVTRPSLNSLVPAISSVNTSGKTITYGNPDLDPFRADSVDMSAEWYFGKQGILAAQPFYKKVKSFIVDGVQTMTFRQSGLPTSLVPADDLDVTYSFNQPVNGKGANIYGLELIYQQGLDFLPAPFDGLGYILNYTYAYSRAEFQPAAGVTKKYDLPGLSRNSANATLYYETDVYGGRVSVNYRDGYLQSIPGGNGNDVSGYHSALNLDVSLFYNINEKLKVTLEGVNLTNQAEDQYVDSVGDRVYSFTRSGAQYLLGVRYSY